MCIRDRSCCWHRIAGPSEQVAWPSWPEPASAWGRSSVAARPHRPARTAGRRADRWLRSKGHPHTKQVGRQHRAGCAARVWPVSLSLGCDWDVRTGRGCWVLGAEEGAALYWVGAWQRPIPTSGDPFDLGGDGGIRIYESATRGHVNPERPYPKSITSQCPGSA